MTMPLGLQEHVFSSDEFPVSKRILYHAGLLTPVLRELFDDIYVEELAAEEDEEIYQRRSVIKQVNSDAVLLLADLKIRKKPLPIAMLEQLRNTVIPFGQLLVDYGVSVSLINQQYFLDQASEQQVRIGRSHTIYQVAAGQARQRLCDVKELLVNERLLRQLLAK